MISAIRKIIHSSTDLIPPLNSTYLLNSKNEETVKQYYNAINTKNWVLLETLLHEELGPGPMWEYIKEVTQTGVNPYIEFLKLLGYDNEIITEAENRIVQVINKQSFAEYAKWSSKFQSNIEIQDMLAGENRVWTTVTSTFITFNQHKLNHSGIDHFEFKDSKIISRYGAGRFLSSIIQMGKVIIAENNKEEIDNYLQVLRNLGILPEKAKI